MRLRRGKPDDDDVSLEGLFADPPGTPQHAAANPQGSGPPRSDRVSVLLSLLLVVGLTIAAIAYFTAGSSPSARPAAAPATATASVTTSVPSPPATPVTPVAPPAAVPVAPPGAVPVAPPSASVAKYPPRRATRTPVVTPVSSRTSARSHRHVQPTRAVVLDGSEGAVLDVSDLVADAVAIQDGDGFLKDTVGTLTGSMSTGISSTGMSSTGMSWDGGNHHGCCHCYDGGADEPAGWT